MKRYDLTKKEDGWALTGQGAQRASLKADTKAEAIHKTQAFMADKVGSVRIHKENGRIQEERTYQRKNDPRSSKG
ncbi:DUF2188 domain-containing protein [Luteibacter aegosomatis]|uniref:DUF2188 domain-containing protein n=1 Tax=Luteibacter aegosomatis TaxID=2911537 RepID=UPI001FF954D1|nr:DUF2188 domain-containing protein [Luteibacter aegosomatis]UPG84515.1 DUF2188 domain-containing protein [Luteibacter aegosomatis]